MENKKELTELKPGVAFTASGKTYVPTESITIGRFERLEELEEELLMFSDKRTCHAVMLKAMESINAYRPGEAYAILYNKIDSDGRNAKMNHYILRLCAAYINAEGEDTRYLSEETITAKIQDWSEEGFSVAPFLLFAVTAFRELLQLYRRPIVNILEGAKTIKEVLNEVTDIKNLMASSGPEASSNGSLVTSGTTDGNSG